MSSISDLIQAAQAGKPVEFEDTFNSLMGPRLAERVDALIPDAAASMFVTPSEE